MLTDVVVDLLDRHSIDAVENFLDGLNVAARRHFEQLASQNPHAHEVRCGFHFEHQRVETELFADAAFVSRQKCQANTCNFLFHVKHYCAVSSPPSSLNRPVMCWG